MRCSIFLSVVFHAALCIGMQPFGDQAPLVSNCRKAVEDDMVLGEYVKKCVYLCQGLPYRSAKEDDGTQCVKIVGGERALGFCKDGQCELDVKEK
ncbi:hypothetical protein V5799_015533 [Amblyomma americanum]|uniref:Secreted protein n=1 Tax=Amblyomma americanum TaxID=6943 RepID=A0AAQ4F7L1_AMBAM